MPEPHVDLRRLRVSQLLNRHLTQREIVTALQSQGVVNPDTKKPYSLGTINRDIQIIKADWRKQAGDHMVNHVARILAELQELKRTSWGMGDRKSIVDAIGKEIEVLGLKRINLVGMLRHKFDVDEMTDAELVEVLKGSGDLDLTEIDGLDEFEE